MPVWHVRDLIVALGGSNGIHSTEDIFNRLAAEVRALNDLTFSQIGDPGTPMLKTNESIPLLERERELKAKASSSADRMASVTVARAAAMECHCTSTEAN